MYGDRRDVARDVPLGAHVGVNAADVVTLGVEDVGLLAVPSEMPHRAMGYWIVTGSVSLCSAPESCVVVTVTV